MLVALCVNVTACTYNVVNMPRWRGCVHLQYRWVANYNDDDQTKEVKNQDDMPESGLLSIGAASESYRNYSQS